MSNTQFTTTSMTMEQMQAEIARLQAEAKNLRLSQGSLTLKVSEKGALSVYGMGRFPVTLYGEQWTRLLGQAERITAFIEANRNKLKTKGQE